MLNTNRLPGTVPTWRRLALCGALAVLLAGCTGLRQRLPFTGPAEAPAPLALRELDIQPGPAMPVGPVPPVVVQLLERNTLVLDLRELPPNGELVLKPLAANWPVRLAFRVQPGRFPLLEVQGARRVQLQVPTDRGTQPLTLPLDPAVHAAGTRELRLRWGGLVP